METSKGQALVMRLAGFIARYVSFPGESGAGVSLVLALWAIHTWMYERFSTTPYVVITAPTKGAGKTLCMEVVGLLCRNARMLATLRAPAVVRMIDGFGGAVTFLFDESEKLAGAAASDARSLLASGYRKGGKHAITVGKSFLEFSTYAPKMFALIGDLMDVLTDRSIRIELERAKPVGDFNWERAIAERDGAALAAAVVKWDRERETEIELVQPEFLVGRDREIWSVLWSIAVALKLDRPTMDLLTRTMADLVAAKTAPRRRYVDSGEAEAGALASTYGEIALRDLRRVLREGETAIWSAVAVERMKDLADGPWRGFKGLGLTSEGLADLLSPFGLRPVDVKRMKQNRKGYQVKAIAAASKG